MSDDATPQAATDATALPATAATGAVQQPKLMPGWVFWVALTWLIGLLLIFVVYSTSEPVRHALPQTLGIKIPVGVPWFGALGGCLISLAGIFAHNKDWDDSYDYWHAVRPLLGAIAGGIGCLLLLVTTQLSTKGMVHTDAAFYYGVAFVLGYAEAAFRSLITSITNVILKPGG